MQPSQQHVAPCVEGVEWGLGTRGLRICDHVREEGNAESKRIIQSVIMWAEIFQIYFASDQILRNAEMSTCRNEMSAENESNIEIGSMYSNLILHTILKSGPLISVLYIYYTADPIQLI